MPDSVPLPASETSPALTLARQFARFSSDALFVLDAEGSVVCWNQAMERLTGFLAEFAESKPVVHLLPALKAAPVAKVLALTLEGEEHTVPALELELPGRLLHCQLRLFSPAPGLVAGMLTPVNRPENAFALTRADAYQSPDARIADATPCIITVYDLEEGQHVYFNKQMEAIMGFSLEEIRAYGPTVLQELIHPEDLPKLTQQIAQVATLPDDETVELEYRVLDKQGQYRWFLVKGSVYARNAAGQATQALAVFLDIHDHRTTKHLLQTVLQTSQVGVMAFQAETDATGQIQDFRFQFANPAACRLLGLNADAVQGASLKQLLESSGSHSCFARYVAAMHQTEPVEFEKQYQLESGVQWLAISAARSGQSLTVTFTDVTRLKKVEQELSESKAFIGKVTDALPVLLRVVNLSTRRPVFANQVLYQTLGLTQEQHQILEQDAFHQQFIHPDDLAQVVNRLENIAASPDGTTLRYKVRVKHQNGQYCWSRLSDTVFSRNAQGQAELVLSVMQDVNELKLSKDLLEGVVNSSTSMIMAFQSVRDAEGRIADFRYTLINPASERFTNYKPEALVGQTLRPFMTDDRQEARFELYREVVENNVQAHFEEYFDLHSGPTWFSISVVKLNDGFVATFTDITERRQAEQKVRESEDFIRRITDATPLIITVFDVRKQEYVFMNRQIGEVLGYTQDQLARMGKVPGLNLVHPDDMARVQEHHQKLHALPDGEVLDFQFRARDAAGEYRWMIARDTVFRRNDDGSIAAILGVSQDINEVKKSKDLLARVLDSSKNGITVFRAVRDGNGQITDFAYTLRNAAAEAMLANREKKSTLGQMWPELYRQELQAKFSQVVETGTPLYQEYLYHSELSIWFDLTATRLDDGLVVTFQDVSARKEAEDRIRKNEALLTEAQQIANLGIWEWDIQTNRITWSDAMYRMFGLEPGTEELTLESYLKLLEPADRQMIDRVIKRSFETKEPYTVNHPIRLPNGTTRHVIGKGRILTDKENRPVRVLGTTMEVTELIKMRRQLHEMEQLTLLGQAIPQIVWTAGPSGRITFANRRWFHYTGTPAEKESLPQGWHLETIHPDDQAATMAAWTTALKAQDEFEAEFRLRRHDGEYRWFLARAVPVKDEFGRLLRWFGTSTDIHDQKQTLEEMARIQEALSHYNQELKHKNEELRKINTDLDNFIYTASHDLKAPINNIEGLLDLLRTEVETDSDLTVRVFELMQRSIARFKNTLTDLSEISKIERQHDDVGLVNLPEVLDDVESYIEQLLTETKAKVRMQLEVEELYFSRKNIRSILYNLLSNALKYRHPERLPQVLLTVRQAGENQVELVVQDNGLGLDTSSKDRVFEMFRREHSHVEGSGVGLYIVKRMVENAGGTITLETTLGQGCTFRVLLPQPASGELAAISQT